MRLIVVGAGAVGGVVAGLLVESGADVLSVARGQHLDAIRDHGLTLGTPTGFRTIELPVVPSVRDVDWNDDDVVILAVKGQDTHSLLAELAPVAPPDVPLVCLQNGIENERAALRWFRNVYGVVVMLPGTFLEAGSVALHASPVPGVLDVGRWPQGIDETCRVIAQVFKHAGFVSTARDDIPRWKYAKLLRNLTNAVEALCGREEGGSRIMELAAEEGKRTLDAAGIAYTPDEENAERFGDLLNLQPVIGQDRQGGSSWQSLARGTGSIETDYLNGEIVMLGRLYGVPTPVNALLQQLAREHARAQRPPASVSAAAVLAQLGATTP